MLGVFISPVHFGQDLFCYSNFNFTLAVVVNQVLFLKIYEYYNFKQNKLRAYCSFIKYSFYL